ncbi:MAG: hypothetical protein JWN40_5955, partial [Phycisphaerales bacterium]|nr:hypothetical protein [Phycisphaerales bacterium]
MRPGFGCTEEREGRFFNMNRIQNQVVVPDYQSNQIKRRKRLRRACIWFILFGLSLLLIAKFPTLYKRVRLFHVQNKCLRFEAKTDDLIFAYLNQDAIQVEVSRNSELRVTKYWCPGGHYAGRIP